jgi:hypothetical protein
MNMYFFSDEDRVVSRRSLLLRDFDDGAVELRSFKSLFRLGFDSDFSLYFRLADSSLEEVFALRRTSDLKYN